MFPSVKGPDFPYLREYLGHLRRQQLPTRRSAVERVGSFAGFGLLIGSLLILANGGASTLALSVILLAAATLAFLVRPPKRVPSPEEVRLTEAKHVAFRLEVMIQKNRLHRDLDAASLTVFEESSRSWSQVQSVFGSPFWKSDTLPLRYSEVRSRAQGAADAAMMDLLRLYQNQVPERVENRTPIDYVDEALGSLGVSAKQRRAPSPAVWSARSVAEKLRDLASEAERVSQKAALDLPADPNEESSHALDLALGELRSISQAEDELRQDLRG